MRCPDKIKRMQQAPTTIRGSSVSANLAKETPAIKPSAVTGLGPTTQLTMIQLHAPQRSPASTVQTKGIAINDDAALEREADVMGERSLLSHQPATSPTAQMVSASPAVIQGYFRIDNANQAAAGVQINSTLPAMEHHPGTASHRDIGGNLNIVEDNPALGAGPTTTLRIADDGRLAIEDVDLTGRQPRVFFAEQNLITEANEQLRARTGNNKLAVNPAIVVDVPEAGNMANIHHLVEVTPANFTSSTNCDAVAEGLTGTSSSLTDVKLAAGAPVNAPRGTRDTYDQLAHYAARGNDPGTLNAHVLDATGHTGVHAAHGLAPVPLPDYANVINQIAHERAHPGGAALWLHGGVSDTAVNMEGREQALGINSYADPGIGDMYGSMSLGGLRNFGGADYRQWDEQRAQYMGPSQPGALRHWGTHFGGVMAKSGSDRITLENYNRTAEDAGIGGAAGDHGRWYFQMYGSKRVAPLAVDPLLAAHIQAGDDVVGVDQSWHHTWSQAGRPVSNAVTAVIGKREQPLNAGVLAALAHAGVAGSGEITRGHETDLKINCTPAMQTQLMMPFQGGYSDMFWNMFGWQKPGRELAGHAAVLRVFATTNGNANAKYQAALAARTQLALCGVASQSNTTPPLLIPALTGYGVTVLPAGV